MGNIRCTAESELPTQWGHFTLRHYVNEQGDEGLLLTHGRAESPRLCRIHSECLTGEAFSSLRCDCKEQLENAFLQMTEAGSGVIIYLRQEGRGIGLENKIRAYALQDQGRDTLDANIELGLSADARRYDLAVDILKEQGIKAVKLLTNNPNKISSLKEAGIKVLRRSHWVSDIEECEGYLETKRQRMGHLGLNS